MDRVEVSAGNGRTLTLERASPPGDDVVLVYRATLAVPEGVVTTVVHDHRDLLATYVRGLADAWSGVDGTRSFASLEGQMTIDARHDGLGTVSCTVHLRQPWPPEWDFAARLDLDAGAQLDRLADDVRAFVD